MRRPLAVVLATLAVALAPAAARGEEATATATATPTPTPDADVSPPPDLTPEAAAAQAAAADADARSAAAAGMQLPESTQRAGAEAKAVLAQHRRPRAALPMVGLALGGGFPDLATVSLLVRPIPSIRFVGGPTWGYIGWGLHGGVVFVPGNWGVTPTFSLEAGKLFRSDATRFVKEDENAVWLRPLLRAVDYQYVAADVGLELGSPRGFAFTLRVGLSWVTVKANGLATIESDDGTRLTLTDLTIRATLPSAKVGFQYWF